MTLRGFWLGPRFLLRIVVAGKPLRLVDDAACVLAPGVIRSTKKQNEKRAESPIISFLVQLLPPESWKSEEVDAKFGNP